MLAPSDLRCGEDDVDTKELIFCRDSIVAVDGELVSGKSLSQLAELILGPPSSSLECCFKSKASQQLYNVSLTRGALLGCGIASS